MVSTLPPDVATRVQESAPHVSRDGERAVVWLDGEHDFATADVLANILAHVISADDAHLIVDLSGVTFMGTATIDELLQARNLLLGLSRKMTVRSPSKCARRLLELCDLGGLIQPSEGAMRTSPPLPM